jgi:Putative FMN-binding domain
VVVIGGLGSFWGVVVAAIHLPTVLKDDGPYGVIECHLARANPHWRDLAAGDEALMIFQGAEGEEIMDKLEERVGPKGRKLFEQFLRKVNKLQAQQYLEAQAQRGVTERSEERGPG